MYEQLDVSQFRSKPPSFLNAITEVPRTLVEISTLAATLPLLSALPRGDGHTVMLLPGFLAGDESTAVLRRYLRHMGYTALPWTLGRNTGKIELLRDLLPKRFEDLCRAGHGKITLIGQSLGGVYAREIARTYPDHIRQVITLGSPFAVKHAGATNPVVQRLFEQQTGMTVEQMRSAIDELDPHKTPPVPLTAIYSKGDGIVHWQVCMEAEEDHQTQNIEVLGSHCGMAFNPLIYHIIADRLSQQDKHWQKYKMCQLIKARASTE
ncbi:MAG: alpha/beta fold hydrolase [Pseudomonadales bacterium]|nr:alpha/beta fold hydrolase [Pseudomonadales bacterium]